MLEILYHTFFKPSQQSELTAQVYDNHQNLIQVLSKEQRRQVLRIIDAGSALEEIHTKESFACGFQTAMRLMIELEQP